MKFAVMKFRIRRELPVIFIYFFKYETIETHGRAFLTLDILSTGTVGSTRLKVKNKWFGRGIKASVRVPILTVPVFFLYLTHKLHVQLKLGAFMNYYLTDISKAVTIL